MAKSKSPFVCRRCGLSVTLWMGKTWKHQGGSNASSACVRLGKKADPVEREEYEAEERRFVEAARYALGNRLKGRDKSE